jgi:hypothetical protein
VTAKTRYFVITSLLVMFVGLGTGLVAFYVGFPATAFFNRDNPEELKYLPSTAALVGYVDVREIMSSDLRQRLRQGFGGEAQDNGRREFQELTGINFETDIERIIACLDASTPLSAGDNGVVIAKGVFDPVKIEALMREHGAQVQEYNGKRLIIAPRFSPDRDNFASPDNSTNNFAPHLEPSSWQLALTFIEPGLAAFGASKLVQHAIDLHATGGDSAATNDELVAHVRELEGGNAWVVGRFDVLRARANLPDIVANQLPPITWFGFRGHVDGGLQARVTAEARDDESANMLRDVVRGFLALAKLQTSSKPEFQHFVQSLQLGGTGKTVSLSLDVPAQVFDALGAALPKQPATRSPSPQ